MSEPHARFQAWLLAGAEGNPPRDLAVHASVCSACRASIAAFDRLDFIDPGATTVPAPTRPVMRGVLVRVGRAVGATVGVMIAATVLGVGGWQLIDAARGGPGGGIAQASRTPDQDVLAGSGTPGATSQETSASASMASASDVPTAAPSSDGPAATPRPGATATPRPALTPQPSVPAPTSTPLTSTPPTSTPPISTPAPTVPGPPVITSVSRGETGGVNIAWTAPVTDGGSAITGYNIWGGSESGNLALLTGAGVQLSYLDDLCGLADVCFYQISAVNGVDEGPRSVEVPAP